MLKNVCRVCSRYASGKRSLKIFESSNRKLLWYIEILIGVRLERYEFLPELICNCCQQELENGIRFRKRIIGAQLNILDSLAEEERNEVSESYQEMLISADKQIQEARNEFVHVNEDEEMVQQYCESPLKEEELFLVPDEISIVAETAENSESYVYDSDDEVAVLDNVLDDEYEIEVCIDNMQKPQRASKPKPEKHKGRAGDIYICDLCGNHISGRMSFDVHLRRHRGEKEHECEVCQDRFCTTSELRRHMRKHTGERPFACKYCGRSFSDYSTRVKHERTHTNERPYACGECGKAFTTAYILKNHMLVHSGERAFRCDLCDKSFTRNTHLATHNRSIVHQRNLEKQTLSSVKSK